MTLSKQDKEAYILDLTQCLDELDLATTAIAEELESIRGIAKDAYDVLNNLQDSE